MKKMRKALSLILALVLAFSLAAVPAFAADTTEAETSTSDTAYGQLHNGLLSEILSRIDIANDDHFIHGIVGVNIKDLVDHIGSDSNFVHGIVNVDVGDLFKDIASNNNYMHGIITITDNTVNINFGQVIGDIAAGGANSEAAQQAMALLEKYISQMVNNSGSGTGTEPAQSTGLLDTTNHNAYVSGRTATTFVPNGTLTRAEAVTILNRVLGHSCDLTFVQANAQVASHFTDVTPGAWYYAAVTEASVGHTFTELTGIERWTALA